MTNGFLREKIAVGIRDTAANKSIEIFAPYDENPGTRVDRTDFMVADGQRPLNQAGGLRRQRPKTEQATSANI